MQPTPNIPGQNERLLAALAHISAPAPLFSLITPLLIWAVQRGRSRYAAFQAGQAVVIQALMAAVAAIGFGCYLAGFFLVFPSPTAVGESMLQFAVLSLLVTAVIELGFIIYSLVGAFFAFQGKDFHYALVGRLVERYQSQK